MNKCKRYGKENPAEIWKYFNLKTEGHQCNRCYKKWTGKMDNFIHTCTPGMRNKDGTFKNLTKNNE